MKVSASTRTAQRPSPREFAGRRDFAAENPLVPLPANAPANLMRKHGRDVLRFSCGGSPAEGSDAGSRPRNGQVMLLVASAITPLSPFTPRQLQSAVLIADFMPSVMVGPASRHYPMCFRCAELADPEYCGNYSKFLLTYIKTTGQSSTGGNLSVDRPFPRGTFRTQRLAALAAPQGVPPVNATGQASDGAHDAQHLRDPGRELKDVTSPAADDAHRAASNAVFGADDTAKAQGQRGVGFATAARERPAQGGEKAKDAGAARGSSLARENRDAAEDLEENSSAIAAHGRAAVDSVKGVAEALRSQSVGDLIGKAGAFAQRQPVQPNSPAVQCKPRAIRERTS